MSVGQIGGSVGQYNTSVYRLTGDPLTYSSSMLNLRGLVVTSQIKPRVMVLYIYFNQCQLQVGMLTMSIYRTAKMTSVFNRDFILVRPGC